MKSVPLSTTDPMVGGVGQGVVIDSVRRMGGVLPGQRDIVERVEVIKGPQAALFGRSTFSGAIATNRSPARGPSW